MSPLSKRGHVRALQTSRLPNLQDHRCRNSASQSNGKHLSSSMTGINNAAGPFMKIQDFSSQITKCVLGIIVCQAILLLAWISLAADMRLVNYASVQSLLNAIPNQASQHPEFFMAAQAIREASNHIDILNFIILLVSIAVVVLAVRLWFYGRKSTVNKTGYSV